MENKLSQDQINALFGAASKGGEEAVEEILNKGQFEKIQEYDFNRPTKFKQENLKSLVSIANVFGRNFATLLTARLRLPVQLQVSTEIEQIPYGTEYVEKMPKNQFVFCEVDLGTEDKKKIIVQFDLAMIFAIHKKLMGAKTVEISSVVKNLTDIEILTTEEWIQELLFPQLEEAFQNVADFNLSISKLETDPQYVKITAPTDMIALVPIDVFIGGNKTGMSLCIPYNSLESSMDSLTTENVHELFIEKDSKSEIGLIEHHLNFVKRKVDVELGKTEISLKELLKFTKGDVLMLNQSIEDDLIGYISDLPKFSCVMGRDGNKVAVKITSFAKKEAVEDE